MSAKKRSRGKRWLIFSVVIIIVAVLVTPLLRRPRGAQYESVDAKIGDITTYYSFSGNVEAKLRQTVMADRIMQISAVKVAEGDEVKEGDLLIENTAGDKIEAEINGIVTGVFVEENSQVMAGTKLMSLVDNNDLQISVKVDEYDISSLDIGKEAEVRIGAIDKEITGTVRNISLEGQVINGVSYFTASIDLERDSDIRIGMSAEVTFIKDHVEAVITLPMTAIQFDENNNPYVLKRDSNGAPVKTDITTGINDGTTVEIAGGVSSGETILYYKNNTMGDMGFFRGPNRNSGRSGRS